MNSVRKVLLDNLNNAGVEGFSSAVKKCIYEGRKRYFTFFSGISTKTDLRLFSEKTLQHIEKLSFQHTTSLLHSFSIPIYRNFQLFTSLTGRIRSLIEKEEPSVEDSVKIINACGRLHYSDSQLFEHLLKIIEGSIKSLRTKNIVSILHSLTKLRYTDFRLLSSLSLVPLENLEEISEVALANFSIANSKIYTPERTKDPWFLENGKKVMDCLLPEVKSRSLLSSPLDNLRHVIALSNLKHLAENRDEVSKCLDNLLRSLNCPLLYYQHLVVLLECLVSLDYLDSDFIIKVLVPNLLNKRTESNTSYEMDLRLLKSLSKLEKLDKTYQFLFDQILENLSGNLGRHPHLIGHTFYLINLLKLNPERFLKSLQSYLEGKSYSLDPDSVSQVKVSIENSNQDWTILSSLIDN